jgi:excisionase family DNA binding protein
MNEIEPLYSIAEVCRLLGIQRTTFYSRLKAGRFRAVRIEGSIRVPRGELVKYLAQATPISATASA